MIDVNDFSVVKLNFRIEMGDGSVWAIPILDIALNRAEYYAKDFNGDLIESLLKDTLPLFEDDYSEIADWAQNNMNWEDVKKSAVMVSPPNSYKKYSEDWCSGKWEVGNGKN